MTSLLLYGSAIFGIWSYFTTRTKETTLILSLTPISNINDVREILDKFQSYSIAKTLQITNYKEIKTYIFDYGNHIKITVKITHYGKLGFYIPSIESHVGRLKCEEISE